MRKFILACAAALTILLGSPLSPAVAQSGTIMKPKKQWDLVYASAYKDGGAGTIADPYTLTGSNPLAAALADCPATGCTIDLGNYVYNLGTADPAVNITKTSSASDRRFYRIIGNGAILNYAGTGAAIRVWQDHTGTPGNSIQGNFGNEMSGFSLRQTGTSRTGTGVWFNYATLWNIHDVEVGTMKSDRASGDNGFEYGIRFAEKTGSYQTVDDFNTIEHCRFSGNTHAVYAGQQADNLKIFGNYFEGNPNVNSAQDGLEIRASNGILISGNTFNFFKFSASMFAIKLNGDVTGVDISGNYMEGNWTGIRLDTQQDMDGIHISGNLISTNSVTGTGGSPAFGIDAGTASDTWRLRGLVITGNTFDTLGDNEYGIRLRKDVRNAVVEGNQYRLVGTTTDFNNITLPGATGVYTGEGRREQSTVGDNPQTSILHNSSGTVGIRMESTAANSDCTASTVPFPCCTGSGTGTCDDNSPTFQMVAGGSSHASMNSYVETSGRYVMNNGADRFSVSAAGVVAAGTNFSGALTGDVTGNLTGSVTAGSGKTVNAAAGTMRLPTAASPPSCGVGDIYFNSAATLGQQLYVCTATNTFTLMGDGGGSIAFNNLSGGTNTTSAMVVGTGSSISATGSGVIAATTVLGSGVSGNITGTAANVSGTVDTTHGGTNLSAYAQGDLLYASAANVLSRLAKNTTADRYVCNTGTSNNPAWCQIVLSVDASFSGALGATHGGTGLAVGTSGGINYWSSTTTMASSALLASTGIVIGGGAGAAPSSSLATATSGGSIAIPASQTIDIDAHPSSGGSLLLKEDAGHGTNTFTIKVPDAGLTESKTATLVAATGNFPASAIEDSGTVNKCARFGAAGVLEADSGDCGASSGDVTSVGPGCAAGACFTNGLATSGTVWMVWEGTTDSDTNQININVPADPTAAINWTIPNAATALTFFSGTDTVAGKATVDVFTNKTLNVESTGNVLTTLDKIWLPAAGCVGSTAASFWDLPAIAPTPNCVTGSETQKAYLDFPDVANAYKAETTIQLPADWTGNIDAIIRWLTPAISNDVVWKLTTACVADGETDDTAYSTASSVTDTAQGTGSRMNSAAIANVVQTGCAAGELMHMQISRDIGNTGDTITGSAVRLVGVEITLRRAQ